ncbi:hypothetical protein B0J18DRAFT_287568 [Chaetomium sp. MPI-SDFR-AT-0129]|nr:hypothetical protein B0J18DRAFT_287568 [Chaetomium sp. MPI-SDFR-AT-0129]
MMISTFVALPSPFVGLLVLSVNMACCSFVLEVLEEYSFVPNLTPSFRTSLEPLPRRQTTSPTHKQTEHTNSTKSNTQRWPVAWRSWLLSLRHFGYHTVHSTDQRICDMPAIGF